MARSSPPDIHAVRVDADLVVLDVAADAYLCLPGSDPDLERSLTVSGDCPPLPMRPAPDRPAAALRSRDLANLALAYFDYLVFYAGRPFAAILRHARRPRAAADVDIEELWRLTAVFHRASVWLPVPGKCLARSFLLLCFLRRSGASANWVFGVRTWPFRAHCWLQAGDIVLDDTPERLRAYAPILAVGP